MYEAFYGFSEDPFRISPDHRFSYPHQSYIKAKNHLEYGLLRGEGIVVITGEPGTGKSTVINDLLTDYQSDELVVAKLLTTRIDSYELLRMMAYSFGLDALTMDKATVLTQLEQFLLELFDSQRRALLIVDEAQNLSIDSLEELRLLSNLQQYEHPLLQIFLIGQPKLQELIRDPLLEQLRQRLVAACHFEPLKSEETRHYIEHRLSVVGWKQDPKITDEAFRLIHQFSAGIPRRVNLICNRLLLHGHVESLHELSAGDVHQVITELPAEMNFSEKLDDSAATTEISSAKAANSSALSRRKLPDGDSGQAYSLQATDTVRLYQAGTRETKTRSHTKRRPNNHQARVALHPNMDKHDRRTSSSKTQERQIPRQQAATDPLFSLSKERTRGPSTDSESQSNVTSGPATTQGDRQAQSHLPPNSAIPPAHIRIGRGSRKQRYFLRPILAAVIFIAVFGISYGYLRLNPGKYEYSEGMSFEPDDSTADLKDPTSRNSISDEERPSEAYVYAQKESSSDLLNLTLSSLLPGPENIRDLGISGDISGYPPSSLQSPDGETALRSIQNKEHQNLILEDESTQIIEEVIGENKVITGKPAPNSRQGRINDSSTDDDDEGWRHDRPPSTQGTQVDTNLPQPRVSLGSKDAGIESKGGQLVINRDLENALRHYAPMVERLNNGSLKITLLSELSFEADSVRLKRNTSSMLDKIAFVMRNYEGFLIEVIAQEGARNIAAIEPRALSRQRAETVAGYLIENGISAHRVLKAKYTETYPNDSSTDVGPRNGRQHEIGIYLTPQA